MASQGGSYTFGNFRANAEELERLKKQAIAGAMFEKAAWAEAGLKDGLKVLDLGCGPGLITLEMARQHPGSTFVGVDCNKDLLGVAHAAKEMAGAKNVEFQEGDATDLKLPEASFDFVYVRLVFQHSPAPEKIMKGIARVLKPGGKVLVVDVDDGWWELYPKPEGFDEFRTEAMAGQRARGGDREIGRKLGFLMHQAGLTQVKNRARVITTDDVGIAAFLEITTAFKLEFFSKERLGAGEKMLASIKSVQGWPYVWGGVALFFGMGTKA